MQLNRNYIYILLLSIAVLFACSTENYKPVLKTDNNGYQYEEVTNDPSKTRLYTLENGLKVYLSINKDEPRINTIIAVRTGSVNDPEGYTGLAHYFEHLMFKGTDEIGTLNWDKEKVLIDSIAALYEMHRGANSRDEKKRIYKQIDQTSYEASKYAIPNEYQRMVGLIGANETNAGVSYDYTIFTNDIPSNELDRWLDMEYERFSDPVLRLFHTELETVYEEYNLMQNRDEHRLVLAMMENLFQQYPMRNNILGTAEDLQNATMLDVLGFFKTWYVPNNMALLMSGDLDPEEVIMKVDTTFGQMKQKALPKITFPEENPIKEPIVKNIYGPDMEMFNMVFRFDGRNSTDRMMVYMVDMLLNNAVAGLIDLNLVQQQKVLYAGCTPTFYNDYGMHFFYGVPRSGQTLDETRNLVLAEIEKIKRGDFEPWLMQAVVNDLRVHRLKLEESNNGIKINLDVFVSQSTIADELAFLDKLERISKSELVAFAREHYKDNYVVINKLNGEPKDVVKIDKPDITPIIINRDQQSEYFKLFAERESKPLKPEFLDFKAAIKKETIQEGLELNYIKNTSNNLFTLTYVLEMGQNTNPELALALKYLPYLGTHIYSPDKVREEFYKLGIKLQTKVGEDRSMIFVSGLERNLLPGIELLEHLLMNAQPNNDAYNSLVEGILKERQNVKRNPKFIRTALINYGKYGSESSFKNVLSEQQLKETNPADLVALIKNTNTFKHTVFYYGAKSLYEIRKVVKNRHKVAEVLQDIPQNHKYKTVAFDRPKVLFLNYPQSQVEILMLAKDKMFDADTKVVASVFNEYYGNSMSSVVLQEIREAKALAYSAWANYETPRSISEEFFVSAALSTQPDKMEDAILGMNDILGSMIESEHAYKIACENIIKRIESERIVKQKIFWNCLDNSKLGIDYDIRQKLYEKAKSLSLNDIRSFFDEHIKDKKYTYVIIGDRERLDMNVLEKIAPVEELSLYELFNY